MKIKYVFLLSLIMTSSVYAGSNLQQMLAARFSQADANHDGKLSLEEAKSGMPRMAAKFDKIDSAHTGYITLKQISAAAAQQGR